MDHDADLIATVHPIIKDRSREALDAIRGSRHCVFPIQPSPPRPSPMPYDSRETTPVPESTAVVEPQVAENSYLELRFSCIPETSHGFLFGRNPRCDVVLPNLVGLSHYHFAVTFDDSRRLVVSDLHSSTGTQVTYNEEGKGFRRGHRWIIGGVNEADGADIIVSLYGNIAFRIVANISEHVRTLPSSSAVYNTLVAAYRTGAADAGSLFEALNLRIQQRTALPSGAQTPGTESICLGKEIGRGSFGLVTRYWNVQTGYRHVVKAPLPQRIAAGIVDVAAWKNEAHILRLVSQHRHPNIVQFLDATFDPYPQILLEFVPGGSLDDHTNLSAVERHMVLCQGLSALVYLHESDPPVVHRDIKPGNILVSSRCEGRIDIKLSDFGMSRDYNDMSTICGTADYLAPEIWASDNYTRAGGGERQSYSESVDVWSLGVVMYEQRCPLPSVGSRRGNGGWTHGLDWYAIMLDRFWGDRQQSRSALSGLLLDRMIVMTPSLRDSARVCLEHALKLTSENTT